MRWSTLLLLGLTLMVVQTTLGETFRLGGVPSG
jgi:hypothetical protein